MEIVGWLKEKSDFMREEVEEEGLMLPKDFHKDIVKHVTLSTRSFNCKYPRYFLSCSHFLQESEALHYMKYFYGENAFLNSTLVFSEKRVVHEGEDYDAVHEDNKLILPVNMNTLSNVYICRELIRLLKEDNHNEYISKYVYGEVLPIFHEYIYALENKGRKAKNVVGFRLDSLKNTFDILEYIKNNGYFDNKFYEEYSLLDFNVYAIGHYYALLLLDRYMEDKDRVMNLVSKVINKEITTSDLLDLLFIKKSNFQVYDETSRKLIQRVF